MKELVDHPPLLEFRVNWRGAGAFRTVFFVHQYEDVQFLIFVSATIKTATHSAEFEQLVHESEIFHKKFIQSPENYINLEYGHLNKGYEQSLASAREIPGVAEYLDSAVLAVGHAIASRRIDLGLDLQELADKAGITISEMSAIELGLSHKGFDIQVSPDAVNFEQAL